MTPRARSAAPLLGLVAAIALFAQTRGLDAVAREGQLGPGFWPRLVLAGLALACLARVVAGRRAAPAGGPAGDAIAHGRLAVAIALLVLYAVAAPIAGFPLTTAAFIAGFLLLAGTRSPVTIAGGATVGTVGLLYVFVKLVYLPFPKGAGPFETVTVALYRALGIF